MCVYINGSVDLFYALCIMCVYVYFNDYNIKQSLYRVGACHSRNHFLNE